MFSGRPGASQATSIAFTPPAVETGHSDKVRPREGTGVTGGQHRLGVGHGAELEAGSLGGTRVDPFRCGKGASGAPGPPEPLSNEPR